MFVIGPNNRLHVRLQQNGELDNTALEISQNAIVVSIAKVASHIGLVIYFKHSRVERDTIKHAFNQRQSHLGLNNYCLLTLQASIIIK